MLRQARHARFAISLFFFTNGMIISSVVPHFPEIKSNLELNNSVYGVAIAAMSVGGLLSGAFSAQIMRALGSARTALIFTVVSSVFLALTPHVGHVTFFAAALFMLGACDTLSDLGENTHGIRVERLYRRSILNAFHGTWSMGAVAGGALATLAIGADVSAQIHLAVIAIITTICSVVAYRLCLPGPDTFTVDLIDGPTSPAISTRALGMSKWVVLIALVFLGMGTPLAEDVGASWANLYMREELDTPAKLASLGYVALVSAQLIGRMLGDRFVDRFGERAVATVGGILIAGGMTVTLIFPSLPGTIGALALAGFGSATLIPAATKAANALPGFKPGTGIAICNWLMRFSLLFAPPLIGIIADNVSLRAGIIVLPVVGLLGIVGAQMLSSTRAPRSPRAPRSASVSSEHAQDTQPS